VLSIEVNKEMEGQNTALCCERNKNWRLAGHKAVAGDRRRLRTSGVLQRHNADRPKGFIGQSAGTVSELVTPTVMLNSIQSRAA
jgi:hypothetical protein